MIGFIAGARYRRAVSLRAANIQHDVLWRDFFQRVELDSTFFSQLPQIGVR